ncbi:MAG TPA: thiamine phosphate synthase [Pyrinomonadaceae bacterium]|nr:thiamine phosphate synthase [Pyrinomonadaceae bacterium]
MLATPPPRVYPLTDVAISGLSHAKQVEALIAGGASLIQLREKNAPPATFFAQAQLALEIARQHHCRLVINDRVDLALALNADGVHLGQDDMPPAAARKILGPEAIIGFSTHNVEQARAALDQPIDYLAIGPIFGTTSKQDTAAVLGLEGLQEVRAIVGDIPLVAIGGIDHRSAPLVIDAGADSVAVIAALLSTRGDIHNRTQLLFRATSLS